MNTDKASQTMDIEKFIRREKLGKTNLSAISEYPRDNVILELLYFL
jgi:hypothetical protein